MHNIYFYQTVAPKEIPLILLEVRSNWNQPPLPNMISIAHNSKHIGRRSRLVCKSQIKQPYKYQSSVTVYLNPYHVMYMHLCRFRLTATLPPSIRDPAAERCQQEDPQVLRVSERWDGLCKEWGLSTRSEYLTDLLRVTARRGCANTWRWRSGHSEATGQCLTASSLGTLGLTR